MSESGPFINGTHQDLASRPPNWRSRSLLSTSRSTKDDVVKSLPPSVSAYRRTKTFTETTTPAALLKRHSTKPGVWGRIQVEWGDLDYCILEPSVERMRLDASQPGIIEPEVPHRVELSGPVRFYVEFLREEQS